MSTQVIHDSQQQRYVLKVDGAEAGHASYRASDAGLVITHTEVSPRLQGRGLAATLAREMLDDLRRQGVAVVPRCSYIVAFMRRHPQYVALVPREERSRLALDEPA